MNLNKALNLLLVFVFVVILSWVFIGRYLEIGINKIGDRIAIKTDGINVANIPCLYEKIDNKTIRIQAEIYKERDGYLFICNRKKAKVLVRKDLVVLIESNSR